MRKVLFLLAGIPLLLLSACDDYKIPVPDCEDGLEGVSFSGDLEPYFQTNCISCHGGTYSPDLSQGWAYDELMEGGYVDVDSPCESKLYLVVSGQHGSHTAVGASDEEQSMVRGWIQDGAEDN